MAISRSAIIPKVRSYIGEVPIYTTVATAASGSSTITVSDGTRWDEGAILEFQDNGEQARVKSISVNTLTCDRGWNGTTAAAHSSIEAWRDPQFTYKQIDDSLKEATNELWPYVWKVTDDTITPSTTTKWYDVDATFLDLVNVVQQHGASDVQVGRFTYNGPGKRVAYLANLPTGLVTSGHGLAFPDGFYHPTNTVRLKFRAFITGTSDIEDTGDLNVAEALIDGALARIIQRKEAGRVILGEDLEVARTVSVGARLRTADYYDRQFKNKLVMLKYKLEQKYPRMVR